MFAGGRIPPCKLSPLLTHIRNQSFGKGTIEYVQRYLINDARKSCLHQPLGGGVSTADTRGVSGRIRYLELGCDVKGMGRGHIKRIKDSIHNRRGDARKPKDLD
jgi:hypothetical protein